jgi:SAM-dependent methyltransferase
MEHDIRLDLAAASVSAVITTFNHARFLAEALESVRDQTMPVSEVIVVDDGSTDAPESVVSRFPGVRLIRQANQGVSAARNNGLRAAGGRYIVFLDADDRLMPQMVETNLRQFAERPDCAFVYGAYALVDGDGRFIREVPAGQPGPDPYGGFLRRNLVGMTGTVLFRREMLKSEGGFDPMLRCGEDYDVFLRLARKYPAAASNERLAEYRRHGANSSEDFPRMLAETLNVLRRHAEHAASRDAWRMAYESGVREWQDWFIRQQFKQLLSARPAELPRLAWRTARLASTAPSGVLRQGRHVLTRWRQSRPGAGKVNFGDLRRTAPLSRQFGFDRGTPIDRYYIERFLEQHAADIRGRVLEVGDAAYTKRFGGSKVAQADVLNHATGDPETTFVGDLCEGSNLPSDAFHCIVLTQTLLLLFDLQAAVRTIHRILRPGGVVLMTTNWIQPLDNGEWGPFYWSMTPAALERLLQVAFVKQNVSVSAYGNVLSASSFLYGLASEELPKQALDYSDPRFPVLTVGRAVKE